MVTQNFYDYVNKKAYKSFSKKQRHDAFLSGMAYLRRIDRMASKTEEVFHFTEFYRLVFKKLGMLLPERNFERLAEDMVYNPNKYLFYDDVYRYLPVFKESYKLGLVSDAWPSLHDVYEEAGLKKYFDAFTISTEVGYGKPRREIYEKTMVQMGVSPGDCLYVDDRISNCQGANQAGIKETYLLCRNPLVYWYRRLTCKDHTVINGLKQLEERIQ